MFQGLKTNIALKSSKKNVGFDMKLNKPTVSTKAASYHHWNSQQRRRPVGSNS
jgi:hypothetical protein